MAMALVGLVILAGCTTLAVQNLENVPVVSEKKLTMAQVKKVIKEAGAKRGWRFKELAPGKLKGILNVRGKHTAVIELTFNTKEYSIKYAGSSNLKYDAAKGTIHKNYNAWINNLRNDIDIELSLL